MLGNSRVAAQLAASQEGHSFMEFVRSTVSLDRCTDIRLNITFIYVLSSSFYAYHIKILLFELLLIRSFR
jgi:hypothetical protein